MCFEDIKTEMIRFVCDEGFVYLEFDNLTKFNDKVIHGFTTRIGGVSKGDVATLNLGFSTNDAYEDILKNYKILADKFKVNVNNIVFSKQIHDNKVRIVTREDTMNGFGTRDALLEYDAMVTNVKDVVLMAFFADCVPVLFFDPKQNVAGVAHAGWKGALKNISWEVIDVMEREYGSNPADINVAIGPSIGACCFDVGEDVYLRFKAVFKDEKHYKSIDDDKYKIDLWSVIMSALEERGIDRANIVSSNVCTKCNNNVFYSYRGQKGSTGRLAAIISLK